MSKRLNLQAFLFILSSFLPTTTGLNAGRRKNASSAALGSGCCLQSRKEDSVRPGRGRSTELFLSNRCSDPVPGRCHPQREAGMDRHSVGPISLWKVHIRTVCHCGWKMTCLRFRLEGSKTLSVRVSNCWNMFPEVKVGFLICSIFVWKLIQVRLDYSGL